MSPFLTAYLAFSRISLPFWRISHRRRLKKGKEDPVRLPEKYGNYKTNRPKGEVLWFHALSVGESLALLPLIEMALAQRPGAYVVLTTSTATSQQALKNARLPERCHHILLPIDTATATKRFLRHWKPDLAAFAELDFWPRIMVETHRAGIPMVLINSRMPEHNFHRRKKLGGMIRDVLRLFERLLVQDEASVSRFSALGAQPEKIEVVGALKTFARPLPADEIAHAEMNAIIGDRPVWLAAATIAEEHAAILEAHKAVLEYDQNSLLIIAPRHVADGLGAEKLAQSAGLTVARRGVQQVPEKDCQVYVADTIGEMGLWYRVASVSFVGHSLPLAGRYLEGKNPFEAAALGSAILHGPGISYFAESYEALTENGGAKLVQTPSELAETIIALRDETVRKTLTDGAAKVVEGGRTVLERTWEVLEQQLPVE